MVYVKSGQFTHKCNLVIQDTIAPKALTDNVTLEYGERCEPEDFVKDIEDATTVSVEFVTTKISKQKVTLQVGGETYESVLNVVAVDDVTEVSADYAQEPDFSVAGTCKVTIVFTDLF